MLSGGKPMAEIASAVASDVAIVRVLWAVGPPEQSTGLQPKK